VKASPSVADWGGGMSVGCRPRVQSCRQWMATQSAVVSLAHANQLILRRSKSASDHNSDSASSAVSSSEHLCWYLLVLLQGVWYDAG